MKIKQTIVFNSDVRTATPLSPLRACTAHGTALHWSALHSACGVAHAHAPDIAVRASRARKREGTGNGHQLPTAIRGSGASRESSPTDHTAAHCTAHSPTTSLLLQPAPGTLKVSRAWGRAIRGHYCYWVWRIDASGAGAGVRGGP